MSWFNVDKAGLAAILERRGKFFAIAELLSNAWDSGTNRVSIDLAPVDGKPFADLRVEDWGEGFADLAEASTLFGKSRRAGDASKRGRFNLGEKLVLSVCRWADIQTACGGIGFNEDETTRRYKTSRTEGTLFTAEVRMTRDEYAEVCEKIKRVIPPVGTLFNGIELWRPDSICRFDVKLPTEISDADGQLRRTVRTSTVEVYKDETGTGEILELGIPVVETENGYRVNVLAKVPLSFDRDNVTPAFLRAINVAILNNVHDDLTAEEAAKPWAQEAVGDARATAESVKAVVVKRFGDRAVIATPGDVCANAAAEAAGFTVIPGGALSADAWANIKKGNILIPSSRAFPTPKPDELAAAQEAAKLCPHCGKEI